MKKFYLALALLSLLALSIDAQNEKRLLKFSTNSGNSRIFEYDKDGKLSKMQTIIQDVMDKENHVSTFTYTADKIVQSFYEGNPANTDTRIAILENGIVKSEALTCSYAKGGLPPYTYQYTYTYNNHKQLTEILEVPSIFYTTIYKLTWANSDLTHHMLQGKRTDGRNSFGL